MKNPNVCVFSIGAILFNAFLCSCFGTVFCFFQKQKVVLPGCDPYNAGYNGHSGITQNPSFNLPEHIKRLTTLLLIQNYLNKLVED